MVSITQLQNKLIIFLRLMMEKFDGVRVFWDGKRLHSKSSKTIIDVPQQLEFPSFPFEGELWYVKYVCFNQLIDVLL